jgi:hypothetical protein
MKSKHHPILQLVAVTALLLVSRAAMANFYFTGGAGVGVHDYTTNIGNGTAYKLGVGFIAPDQHFGVEASYFDLGDGYVPTAPTGYLNISGGKFTATLQARHRAMVFGGRLGFYSVNTTDSGVNTSVRSTGITWGGTIGYHLSKYAVFYMDADAYGSVELGGGGTETPVSVMFGIRVGM